LLKTDCILIAGTKHVIGRWPADGMKIDAGVSQLVQAMATYSSAHAGFDPTTATQAPADTGLLPAIAANWHA
jgi:hypothetical protein